MSGAEAKPTAADSFAEQAVKSLNSMYDAGYRAGYATAMLHARGIVDKAFGPKPEEGTANDVAATKE